MGRANLVRQWDDIIYPENNWIDMEFFNWTNREQLEDDSLILIEFIAEFIAAFYWIPLLVGLLIFAALVR